VAVFPLLVFIAVVSCFGLAVLLSIAAILHIATSHGTRTGLGRAVFALVLGILGTLGSVASAALLATTRIEGHRQPARIVRAAPRPPAPPTGDARIVERLRFDVETAAPAARKQEAYAAIADGLREAGFLGYTVDSSSLEPGERGFTLEVTRDADAVCEDVDWLKETRDVVARLVSEGVLEPGEVKLVGRR
jgi:hypothetical protein